MENIKISPSDFSEINITEFIFSEEYSDREELNKNYINTYKFSEFFKLVFYLFAPMIFIFIYLIFPLYPKKINNKILINNSSYSYWYRPIYLIIDNLIFSS